MGACEGSGVETREGTGVGPTVGACEGSGVGTHEGTGVGPTVSACEGAEVGTAVGDGVGHLLTLTVQSVAAVAGLVETRSATE